MHVELPERVSLVSIDVAWTRQRSILPAARRLLAEEGDVITLIKPHYEAVPSMLRKGILPPDHLETIRMQVQSDVRDAGFELFQTVQSPIKGGKGNLELLAWLRPATMK
jgi:23S rRNA (cytidine1920-2'-O)/16S rRNA (cytidine1409-2'-O)-methyltransferase